MIPGAPRRNGLRETCLVIELGLQGRDVPPPLLAPLGVLGCKLPTGFLPQQAVRVITRVITGCFGVNYPRDLLGRGSSFFNGIFLTGNRASV